MATREEALARLNNIKQQREQNIQERYNNIIKNRDLYIEQQKQMQEQQRLQEEQRKQEEEQQKIKDQQRKQEIQQMKKQASEITALSKQYNTNQGVNKSKLELPQAKNNVKMKVVTSKNLAKDLNISEEEAQKRIDEQKQREENDVLGKWSNKIRNSSIGNSPGGEFIAEAIDAYNALGDGDLLNIVQNVESGITTGFANAVSYVANVDKKRTEVLDNMGISGKILAGLTGDLGYAFGNKISRQIGYDTIDKWATNLKKQENEKIQKNIDSTYSKVTEKVAELSPSMGNNLVGAGISAVNPVAGTAYFVTSAGGSYYDDAVNRGMNEDQALLYGTVMGTMEGLTERIPVGTMLGAGKNIGKESVKETFKKYGISMAENAIQESVIEPISEISAYAIGGKETADFSDMGSRMLKSGIDGALSAVLLSGANAGVSSAVQLQRKITNNQQITTQEIQQCMQDIQESGKVDVEKIVNQEMQYQAQKVKNTYYDYNTGKKVDSSTQNILNQAEDIIKQNTVSNIEQNPTQTPNNVQNLQQNAVKNQSNVQQQQISQVENKNVLNQNVEGQTETKFSKILNNKKLPMQSYIYEKSDNIKIDNLRKQANKMFNNSQEAHNYVGMLEKIITDKNVEIVFDANLKDENGNLANGKYENGVITINPNSNRVGEFIAIHELTHAIGTKALRKIVDEYRASNPEFDKAVQKLLSNYNQTEITGEALSDVCAQLFGNQEYINNLATKNPNLFRKIYSEIKYLWHQFNGYKNKEQFVEDLMFKWEQAYRKNAKLNNKTGYSFAGENAKIANFKNLDFAKQMEQQGKTAQEIFEQTGWYKGNEGKWRFEIDDSNWNIKDIKIDKNTIYDLEDLLDAPELYEAYPKLKKVPVYFESEMKKNGSYTKADNWYDQIYINSDLLENTDAKSYSMLGLKNQDKLFSTLQHEIQHYIQDKENFSKGASVEYWESKTKDISRKINQIQSDFDYYDKLIGLDKYIEEISEKQNKGEIEITEVPTLIDDYIEKKGYTKIYNTLQTRLQDLRKDDSNYSKQNPYTLYRNTAGEQEARNVQDRIKLSSGEKKNTLPFIKDENTVYAKDSNESFSQKEDIIRIKDNVIEGQSKRKSKSIMKDILKKNIKGSDYFIDGEKYIATNDTVGKLEYGRINYDKNIDMLTRSELKANILYNFKSVIENSVLSKDNNKDTKNHDFADTFDKRKSLINYKGKNYIVTFNVGRKGNVNTIYGIDSIKKTNKKELSYSKAKLNLPVANNSNEPTKLNNSITQNKESVNNLKLPTKSNLDIRYSKDNTTWQQYLEKEFPARGTTTNFQDIKLPTKENTSTQKTSNMQEQQNINLPPPKNKTLNPTEIANLKQEDANTQEQQNISGNIAYKDTTTKVRKHYKSIIDSPYTSDEARAIAKELMGLDTYIPESNTKQLEEADRRISMSGADSELNSLLARATVGGNIKADDIAVGERLIQYYSKTGDKTKLRDAIQATAMAGTTAGQTVQAMSLLNHQTPEGHAVWLQRSVEKMNNDLKKSRGAKAEQFTLTEDMLDKIVNSANTEELNQNLDEVYKELGQQVTKSTIQKIDAWRYFAMLANIRTHNRNVIGNTAMHGIQYGIKNKVAGAIEGVVSKINPNMERTHTIVPASKEVKVFAKADVKNVADRLGLNENKYNPKSRLENNMRTFKSNLMEKTVGKAFEINNKLLEAEDGFGLKAGYTKALAEYMTANKLTPNNITDKQLAKARNYAIQQAQEATFHQNSQLATLINQLSNKNKFAKFMVDAILPFKKTPINIAKTGVQYSPIGLAKNMVYDTVQLRKGNITANQYIDNISKGLTGTGIALVGFALASMGILKASGSSDDDKEKYDQSRGSQTYSVQIGDNTYSLDWLAPTAIPLFVGAECFEIMEESRVTKSSISTDDDSSYNQVIQSAVNILDSFTNAMNPMTEMSMLSGLSSALKSYEQGSSQVLSTFGTNAVKSYVNQFVPTALGQIAKTTDEYERSTTSTKTGVLPKAVDTTKNQIMSKIPGLRQMLPVKTDIWGNELKQSDNMVLRALENSTFPWTRKEVANSKVDIELSKLYEDTGESSVLPDTLDKTFTINKQKYRLTNEEYAEYKDRYGRTSYKLLRELVTTSDYKNMTTAQKQKAVENVYSYAKEMNKIDYADDNDLEVETSTLYDTLEAIEKANGNKSDYLVFLSEISDIEGQGAEKKKINVLANKSYNSETKKAIYENSIGKDDELYNTVMKNTGINMTEYLNYKSQTFTSDKKDDGTVDGKSISGSKKKKVYAYVNNMKITGNQRMLLLGTQYKLTNSERQALAKYVKGLKITNKEKMAIYDKLQGFTVYKDGRVTF